MAPAATRRRLACRARRVRRERGRRAGGAWVRRTRSDGRAPRSCVRSARFVSSTIRVGIPEADWADLGAGAELTPSGPATPAQDDERAARWTSPSSSQTTRSPAKAALGTGPPRGSPQFLSAGKAAVMVDARAWDETQECTPVAAQLAAA